MTRISDERLEEIAGWPAPESDTHAALRELQQLRAAKVMDRAWERVRADAAAEHDRDTVLWMRQKVRESANQYRVGLAVAILDRLLFTRPIPPLVRELVQREFERVPPGREHDEQRSRLAECLEALP